MLALSISADPHWYVETISCCDSAVYTVRFRHKKHLVWVRNRSCFGLPGCVATNSAGACLDVSIIMVISRLQMLKCWLPTGVPLYVSSGSTFENVEMLLKQWSLIKYLQWLSAHKFRRDRLEEWCLVQRIQWFPAYKCWDAVPSGFLLKYPAVSFS